MLVKGVGVTETSPQSSIVPFTVMFPACRSSWLSVLGKPSFSVSCSCFCTVVRSSTFSSTALLPSWVFIMFKVVVPDSSFAAVSVLRSRTPSPSGGVCC